LVRAGGPSGQRGVSWGMNEPSSARNRRCACKQACTPFYEARSVKRPVVASDAFNLLSGLSRRLARAHSVLRWRPFYLIRLELRPRARAGCHLCIAAKLPDALVARSSRRNPVLITPPIAYAAACRRRECHTVPSRSIAQAVTSSFLATATIAILLRVRLPRRVLR